MKVFKTRWFARCARQEGLPDDSLLEAIERAERGLVDADLGGGVIKQRVARAGRGRSGGYRLLVAWRGGERAVFLYGFAKRERENIDEDELPCAARDRRGMAGGGCKTDRARLGRGGFA